MAVCAKTAPWTRSLSKSWRLLSQQLLSCSGWAEAGGWAADSSGEVEGRGPRGAHTGGRKDRAKGS